MKIKSFKVEEWMNEYEKYCRFDLGNTTVNTLNLDELFEICNENKSEFFEKISKIPLGYGHISGNPDFKEGIAKLYKNLTPDNILPTTGAAGANYLVFYSLLEPSDRVISVIPTYQQLYSIPESFNAEVKLLHLKKENDFLPDVKELESLMNKKTKLICLNNPNNPTGVLMDGKLLEQIVEIAKKYDTYILCDEVYRGLNIGEEDIPSICDIYDKGISTSSMSKTFSLAGLRLGWVASKDKNFMEKCVSHRQYNLISCAVTDEIIAALALKNADKIIKKNKKTLRENLVILDNWVKNEPRVSYTKPSAGTTALIYYDVKTESKELCKKLAVERGVFLTPGCCFEQEYCFRAGYGKDKEQLQNGLNEISGLLKEICF